jgi:transposase-like protein
VAAQAAVLPTVPAEVLDQLVNGSMTAECVEEASRAFKKALIERALGAEMSHHLGYAAGADKPEARTNHRNGKSGKTVLTDGGPLRIEFREIGRGEFEPKLIGKHERGFTGFDDQIIAMYARGRLHRENGGIRVRNPSVACFVRELMHVGPNAMLSSAGQRCWPRGRSN